MKNTDFLRTVWQKRWRGLLQKGAKTFIERYLIEENPKEALAPLLSPAIITFLSHGVWILGLALLIFWPQQELTSYLFTNEIPINFLIISEALLVSSAYLNLIAGHGELVMRATMYEQIPLKTLEESKHFFTYGLIKFLIHIFLILVPFLPLMMISAILTQVPWIGIVKGMSIIYSFSLFCRLSGFLIYLKWRGRLIGYLSCRALILALVGITFYYASWLNPVVLIYNLHQKGNELVTTAVNSYTVYVTFITTLILFLTGINQFLIQRQLSQEL